MRKNFRGLTYVLVVCTVALATSGCCSWCRHPTTPSGGNPDAVPVETVPLDVVEVEDAIETALLVQELGLEPITTVGRKVYFRGDDALKTRLADLGYEIRREDANEVLQRVMKAEGPDDEAFMNELGLRILLREKGAWILQGPLARLRALARAGYRLSDLKEREPHPRSIRIFVSGPEQVAEVARAGVDVYSAGFEADSPADQYREKRRYVVYGGAFDYAIDALQARGFTVEIEDDPTENGS